MTRPKIPSIPKDKLNSVEKAFEKEISNRRNTGNTKSKGKRVNQTELCAYIGVTRNTIKSWVKVGLPCKRVGNEMTYDIGQVMKWRIMWETETLQDELVRASQGNENTMSPFQAKLRREVAVALTAELDLAIKREQVANIDDLMEVFSTALIEVRAKLVSMSSRLGGILSHQDEEGITKLLDAEVSDMLEVLSDYE